MAIMATVVVTGVVVAREVNATAGEEVASSTDATWAELESLGSRIDALPTPAPASPALVPARTTPRNAGLGEAVSLGDVRVAAGWQLRTIEPATAMADASMQLQNVRVSLTRAGSALSSVTFELRGADGKAVGTGWCYAPTDAGADTQPTVWCQPFDVTGELASVRVDAQTRS